MHRIPPHLKGIMQYYPDVFLFELNETQYIHLWNKLSSAQYLYADEYEIKTTNWFFYSFQRIKGLLGFTNHSHPEMISYALSKLAYYGYTKKFIQPDFSLMKNSYALFSEINGLLINDIDEEITEQLQNKLIKHYFSVEPYLNIKHSHQMLDINHRFGDSWIKQKAFELIPQLDPQNDSIIDEVIKALDQANFSVNKLTFLKKSKYALAAATYYITQAKGIVPPNFLTRIFWKDPRPAYLAIALAYDSEIATKDTKEFIKYHIKQKEYQSAIKLLEFLDNPKIVLKFLLTIPEVERNSLIQQDTPTAAIMAQYYLEKKQYTVAQKLFKNIEEINPAVAFTISFQEGNYTQAYEIFKRKKSVSSFSVNKCKKLAELFFSNAEEAYQLGKNYRSHKNWEEAKKQYLISLEQKKAAYHLDPLNDYLEHVFTHKRLYALLLIDSDIDVYRPEDSDIAIIQKAITLLKECNSNNVEEKQHQKRALATGLMRQIDTLREKIAFTHSSDIHFKTKEYKIKHQKVFSVFIKTLEELITLLEGTKDKILRLKLAKAHYLLADVQDFFDINISDTNQHYKKAMETAPENPFYILRVTEVFENSDKELRDKGIINLKQMGYTVFDFLQWSNERWVKRDDMIYKIKDIHQLFVGLDVISHNTYSL